MPVLPIYVHYGLGLGTFVVGLVAGTQFAATLVSRLWAGRLADTRGPKPAVLTGLSVAGAAGLLYLFSVHLAATPNTSVANATATTAMMGSSALTTDPVFARWVGIFGSRSTFSNYGKAECTA